MDNGQALQLLERFFYQAQAAARAAVWAQAFLQAGGDETWDAVTSVAASAHNLAALCERVEALEEHFDEIVP